MKPDSTQCRMLATLRGRNAILVYLALRLLCEPTGTTRITHEDLGASLGIPRTRTLHAIEQLVSRGMVRRISPRELALTGTECWKWPTGDAVLPPFGVDSRARLVADQLALFLGLASHPASWYDRVADDARCHSSTTWLGLFRWLRVSSHEGSALIKAEDPVQRLLVRHRAWVRLRARAHRLGLPTE